MDSVHKEILSSMSNKENLWRLPSNLIWEQVTYTRTRLAPILKKKKKKQASYNIKLEN